jgi:hypothetical protein
MRICAVSPVNNESILEQNLLRSPAITDGLPLLAMRGYKSAALAYNDAIDQTSTEFLVFVHQDVYLPAGWVDHVLKCIVEVGEINPNWAVLGLFGATASCTHVGRVWCGAAERELGARLSTPEPVVSIDELLIILRRSSGLRFDDKLPGFHLYGTDIAQTALSRGLGVYVIDAPVVHNTKTVGSLRGAYLQAFRYEAKKWRDRLPIPTVVLTVTTSCLRLYIRELRVFKNRFFVRKCDAIGIKLDPVAIAKQVGYENSLF